MGEAERIEADCQQQSEVAQTQALAVVQEKQNELRKIKAELEQRAKSEEERTIAAGKEARSARAEQQLQAMRADLERLRLEADEVLPAEAQRQAREALQARGRSSQLRGKCQSGSPSQRYVVQSLVKKPGQMPHEVFLIQQIEMVLATGGRDSQSGQIRSESMSLITVMGSLIASLVNAYPEMVRQFLERVDQTLGIDVIGYP